MGYYERNLEALKVNHPELVERLDHPIDARHIEVVYARSGAPRLLVWREDGTQAAVHNEDDPVAVAERTTTQIQRYGKALDLLPFLAYPRELYLLSSSVIKPRFPYPLNLLLSKIRTTQGKHRRRKRSSLAHPLRHHGEYLRLH